MRFLSILLLSLLAVSPVAAQMDEHSHAQMSNERLGTVTFPVSCNAAAQAEFPRAVALLHSFWYEESEKAFRHVASVDPRCGMAWWGVAMSNFHPVWPSPYSPAELQRGMEAARMASHIGAKTARERAYIDAIATLYRDAGKVDTPTRARAYEASMLELTKKFPDDDEAAIFYALILINHGMATPGDKSYAKQKEAAALLNRLLVKYPDHPGIAHYLIHSLDYPELASLALDAAYAYAKIAPSAPHALHMPSHIFVRLGMWPEAIQSNLASAAAARDYADRNHPGTTSAEALHAYDYLTYAWLQRGEDEKAEKLVTELASTHALSIDTLAGFYALASVPARFALETRRWSDAAALSLTAPGLNWQAFPYAEAVTYFARAMGAARSGDPQRARTDVARLTELREKLASEKNAYGSDQVEVQRLAALGWIARAEGNNDEAVRQLTAAADLEDASDKSPVTAGPVLPAREMLGDLLLELGHPADALAAYQSTLTGSPNRLNALSGAARAAQMVGDRAKAAAYYGAVQKLLSD